MSKKKSKRDTKNEVVVTPKLLSRRAGQSIKAGFTKQKWVMFCEQLLLLGYNLTLYEAKKSVSKYIYVKKNGKEFKVRFSNHLPNNERVSQYYNTDKALEAVKEFFNENTN